MVDAVNQQRLKAHIIRDEEAKYTDGWLGILAAFAVAWGFVQLLGFVMETQYNIESLSAVYQARQVEYLLATPFWSNAAHAASIASGLVGAVFLLLRRLRAYYWFLVSIFCTLLTLLDAFLRDGFLVMGPAATGMSLAAVIVNIFIFWAAYSAVQDGQLQAS